MTAALRPRPRSVPLIEIARLLGTDAPAGLDVGGISLDSRSVRPGDLYAALPGHVTHGARFGHSAVAAGAAAVLTDPEGSQIIGPLEVPVLVVDAPRARLGPIAALVYGHPGRDLHLVAVTGTNGKTTVAAMVEAGLTAAGRVTGVVGTVGVFIAGVRHEGVRTTPEATDMHAILAAMLEQGVQSVVMEVSSIAIEEHRVDGIVFDVAAFTNLSQDHLDYHGSMEAYFEAKARLFTPERTRTAIIGIDDGWGRLLRDRCQSPSDSWSLVDPRADWHALRRGHSVAVAGPLGEVHDLVVPLPGSFNLANAVCAYAVLRRSGVDADTAAQGISQAVVAGRMQIVGDARGIVGIVDYAHSPDAIERVLRSVREAYSGRIIAVVGAGGDRDRGKRQFMGGVAARLADVLVITDDNPRSEDPAEIRASIREGALGVSPSDRAEIHEEADRSVAIEAAVGTADVGDVVLVLGKGHEQGQEAAGVTTPFDDAAVLTRALDQGASS